MLGASFPMPGKRQPRITQRTRRHRTIGGVTTSSHESHLKGARAVLCSQSIHENNLVGACRGGVLFGGLCPVHFLQPVLRLRLRGFLRRQWLRLFLWNLCSAGCVLRTTLGRGLLLRSGRSRELLLPTACLREFLVLSRAECRRLQLPACSGRGGQPGFSHPALLALRDHWLKNASASWAVLNRTFRPGNLLL